MADKNEVVVKKDKKDKGEKRRFRRVRETWSELKKVTWPSFGTVVKSTGVVLLVVAIFLVVLLAFDLVLRMFVFGPVTTGDLGTLPGLSIQLLSGAVNILSGGRL